HSSIASEMASAITALGESLPERQRLTAAGPLARAAAAVLPKAEAIRTLRARLAQAPSDDATVRDLLRLTDTPAETVREVVALVDAAPFSEGRYARALVASGHSARALLDHWAELPREVVASSGARLLHARLLALSGDFGQAEAELAALIDAEPTNGAAVVARTSVLTRLGRFDEAEDLLDG